MNKYIHELPCDSCSHNRVCTVSKCFGETEIKTTHPYVKVRLDCTEYMRSGSMPKKVKRTEDMSGEWIDDPINENYCYCSVCAVRQDIKAKFLFSYCPNCGHDMRRMRRIER